MTFSDQPPSERWAALTFRGERLAEVWFKPEGEPSGLVFRVLRSSLQRPGIGQRLTAGNLLKAVGISTEEVESWRHGDASHPAPEGLADPLPPPPDDITHLEVHVRLKPPPQPAAPEASGGPAQWADLEALWKVVLAIEATVDAMRQSMEGVRSQVEAEARRALTGDDKVNALASDIANWNRAKSRAHYALPKANDFIHRATWAVTAAERKRLAELFETPGPAPSPPPADEVLRELEALRKNRQVLSAQGTAVYQECRAIIADVQVALRTLQSNAATRAAKKKSGKGKSY